MALDYFRTTITFNFRAGDCEGEGQGLKESGVAALAQLVEREICNFDAVGSIPTGGTPFSV